MARSLAKVCPFLVTVDLKLKWPELPRPTLDRMMVVFTIWQVYCDGWFKLS